MKQIRDFGDERNKGWCAYCGGPPETRDHVPSKVLLAEPYPENLPVVPACRMCNTSLSRDEEYLACLIECVLAGSVEGAADCPWIARAFARTPALASRLAAARVESDAGVSFLPEHERVRNVIVKLARGHMAFEENEPQLDEPEVVSVAPLAGMDEQQRLRFTTTPGITSWPEVGSRALVRLVEKLDLRDDGWIEVQASRYRYRVLPTGGYDVQMVLREYLAAEVCWT